MADQNRFLRLCSPQRQPRIQDHPYLERILNECPRTSAQRICLLPGGNYPPTNVPRHPLPQWNVWDGYRNCYPQHPNNFLNPRFCGNACVPSQIQNSNIMTSEITSLKPTDSRDLCIQWLRGHPPNPGSQPAMHRFTASNPVHLFVPTLPINIRPTNVRFDCARENNLCRYCNLKFLNANDFAEHLRANMEGLRCSRCKKRFAGTVKYLDHVITCYQ